MGGSDQAGRGSNSLLKEAVAYADTYLKDCGEDKELALVLGWLLTVLKPEDAGVTRLRMLLERIDTDEVQFSEGQPPSRCTGSAIYIYALVAA